MIFFSFILRIIYEMLFRVLFFICISFCSISVSGQQQDSIQIDSLNIIEEKRFQDSIAQLNKVNKNFKESRDAFNSAIDLLNSAIYEDALKEFNIAISIDSLFYHAYFNRGKTNVILENHDDAINDFKQCFLLDNTQLKSLYEIASIYKILNREISSQIYDSILSIDPNQYHALYEKGLLLFIENKIEEAIDMFTKSLSISKQARTYNDRASCYRLLEKYDKAISDYTYAISLDAGLSFIYNNLASLYRKTDQLDKALNYYNIAIQKDSVYDLAYNNRGSLYIKLNDLNKAKLDLEKALSINPNYSLAYNNRGIIKYKTDKYQEALEDFTQAISLKEDYGKAYLNRGICKQMLRDEDGACSDWEKAKELGISISDQYLINDCK